MNPNVTSPPGFWVRHRASDQIRRVSMIRILFDGRMIFQFFHVIKHAGTTIYQVDSTECES